MAVQVSPTQQLLSQGERFYVYGGLKTGDATNPATVNLVSIDNVGLRDCYVQIQPYFSLPASTATNEGLGIQILIDDEIVFEQKSPDPFYRDVQQPINLFVPRQSKLTILSLNTSGNNTQSRGCSVLGWYL